MLKITSLRVIICFLFFSLYGKGQNQYNTWYFGDAAGVDFNSGTPVALSNSSMFAYEGCAGMCDSAGNILFYTNGGDHSTWQGGVWNRNHVLMPNGDLNGYNGCNSADQSSLIIPAPGNPSLFYLFTLDCIENALAGGLRFSIIDMTLDMGNGDITTKDSLVDTDMTEAMCGIRHSNGTDFWVVAHKFGTIEFRAFLVNSSGIQPPVSTLIGPVPNDISQMKANGAGNKICYAQGTISLYDFDNTSGVLSNYLDLIQYGFASSFAPGGNVLYTIGGPASFTLGQYDLTASNIPASFTSIATLPIGQYGEGMMLARDCKIYLAKANNHALDAIYDPDVVGPGCNFIANAVNLGSGMCLYEMPNNIDGLFASLCNGLSTGEIHDNLQFSIQPNPVPDVLFIQPSGFTNGLCITITDFTGKLIFKKEFSGNGLVKLNVKNFSEGMYFLEIQTEKERFEKKFVKN